MMRLLRRTRFWLLPLLAVAAFGFPPVAANIVTSAFAAEAASEAAVRAALLFNFLKFTEWPTAAGIVQLQICVATHEPELFAAMEALSGRQVRNMPLATVRLGHSIGCNVIYVDSRQRWHNNVAEKDATSRALTIGGYAGFVADGGMIEIALQDGKPRFDINLQEAKRAGLRFYPQLLRLARRIVE